LFNHSIRYKMNSTKQAKVRRIYQKVPDIKKSY